MTAPADAEGGVFNAAGRATAREAAQDGELSVDVGEKADPRHGHSRLTMNGMGPGVLPV